MASPYTRSLMTHHEYLLALCYIPSCIVLEARWISREDVRLISTVTSRVHHRSDLDRRRTSKIEKKGSGISKHRTRWRKISSNLTLRLTIIRNGPPSSSLCVQFQSAIVHASLFGSVRTYRLQDMPSGKTTSLS